MQSAGTAVGPVYLAEMAPAKLRGTLNVIFQLFVTIGILIASLINYGTFPLPLITKLQGTLIRKQSCLKSTSFFAQKN